MLFVIIIYVDKISNITSVSNKTDNIFYYCSNNQEKNCFYKIKCKSKAMKIALAEIYCFGLQSKSYIYKCSLTNGSNIDKNNLASIVEVSFSKKKVIGIILNINEYEIDNENNIIFHKKSINLDKIKPINRIIHKNFLSQNLLLFLKQMAFYNIIDIEKLIQMSIPSFWINKKREIEPMACENRIKSKKQQHIQLSPTQSDIANAIYSKSGFNVSVLRGVMGSGKTYVFLDIVRKLLSQYTNGQILIMVPEIALTGQLIKTIKDFCNIEPIIWHSSVSIAKKKKYYANIISGKAKIILSTRSGLLLPYANLKAIIIDEEHDTSYKQDEVPVYNARDMGVLRAKYENIPIVLSSATPSIETITNVMQKKYSIFNLNNQFFNITPPEVTLTSPTTSNQNGCLASTSIEAILNTKQKNEQTMIFINRRGYSRTLKCENCGYEVKCKNCDNLLSYHRKKNELKCHYCGFSKYKYSHCEKCGSERLAPNKGIGVEQLQVEIDKLNSQLHTIIFSSDEIGNENDIKTMMDKINNDDIDVIIGTQIMTKGYHFPRLTTIIVLDIDGTAIDGDFRAYEKMFQMLFQLSGRAGREREGAKIYIQTSNPNNIVLQNIKNYDIEKFYKNEIKQRKQYNLPPYSRFISIIISSNHKEDAETIAMQIGILLSKYLPKSATILGPTESQMFYMKRSYRYRFLIKSDKDLTIINILNRIKDKFDISNKVKVKIDVDPYNFQ